jgi:probable F420-dependent oxidoreductase
MTIPTLAVAAGATEKILLVSGVLLAPLYHPVMLAKLLAVLDRASGGRLIVGVGVGGEFPVEFQALGVPVGERGGRTNESLEIIRKLWTREEVDYQGRYYHLERVTLNPPPIQKPHPPVWVAGRREAAMKRAARYGDGWFPYVYSPEKLEKSINTIKDFSRKDERDISHFQWGILLFGVFDGDRDKATDLAAEALGSRYRFRGDWREVVGQYCLLGTPDDWLRRLREYIDAGARHICIQPVGGNVEGQVELLSSEVLPYFR